LSKLPTRIEDLEKHPPVLEIRFCSCLQH